MENFEGTIDYSKPDKQGQFYKTNLFLKEASSAMGLPPEAGARVARTILKDLVQKLTPEEAQDLQAQLPQGLDEECSQFIVEKPKKELDAAAIKRDIREASGLDNIEPELVARDFWGYLTRFINESAGDTRGKSPNTGEINDVLSQLPKDIKKLFDREIGH